MRFKDFHSSNRILILDFGSHLIQNLTGKIREQGYLCEVHPYDLPHAEIVKFNPAGLILSGTSELPADFDQLRQVGGVEKRLNNKVYDLKVPILGICYGYELMADQLGGKVELKDRETGIHQIQLNPSKLFVGLPPVIDAWVNHSNEVTKLPTGFKTIATNATRKMAFEHKSKPLFGVQFHPEGPTNDGDVIVKNFLEICGVYQDPSKSFKDDFFFSKQTYR